MTAENRIKRVTFAKYMKANYSQEIWTEGIAFYLDGTGFKYKRNPHAHMHPQALQQTFEQFKNRVISAFLMSSTSYRPSALL